MESVKMKKATKTVAFRQLAIYCNIVDNQLLTDAKLPEYIPQHFIIRYFSQDIIKIEDTFANILG